MVHRSMWTLIGLFGFAACGGTSVQRGDGDGTGGSSEGGSAGSAGVRAGGAASSSGVATGGGGGVGGGNSGAGGRGGGVGGGNSGAGGRGGGVSQGGVTSTGGGGTIPDAGLGADAGAAGAPDCEPLLVGSSCTFEETCAILECGAPWAAVDARMCARTFCMWSGECASDERCLAAPITGRLDDPCFPEMDTCFATTSGCSCSANVDCGPSVLCVPIDEFPPDRDCPLEGRDCAGLARAAGTLEAYLSDGFGFPYDPPPSVRSSLEACADAIATRRAADCP